MTQTRRRGLDSPDPERSGNRGGQFIPMVTLRDDLDRVRLRLVSEYNEEVAAAVGTSSIILVGEFHRLEKVSSRGKPFFKEIICGFDVEGDPGEDASCIHCENDLDKRTRFMGWAYVSAYFHQYQNPDYNPRDPKTEDRKWDLVKLGQSTAYKETIDGFQVWMDNFYMKEDLKDLAAMNGRLTDRDLLLTRHGARRSSQTTRKLKDLAVSPLNPVFLEKLLELPTLESIATGEVETMDGKPSDDTAQVEHEEVALDELPDEFGETEIDGAEAIEAAPEETPKAAPKTQEELVDDLFGEDESASEGDVESDGLDGLPF